MEKDTACLHGIRHENYGTGAIAPAIFQASTYGHHSTTNHSQHIYSRVKNPTRQVAEDMVAHLEGATYGFGFSTGMAAIQGVIKLLEDQGQGTHIIATEDLFGGSIRLFTQVSTPHTFDFVDTSNISAIVEKITPATRAIYIESPTNPLGIVTDIAKVKEAIGTRDILLIVDNTFLSPYLQNPIQLGADIVIHSGTKYLGGHSDAMGGFVVLNCPQLAEKLDFIHVTTGATLAPMDAFLISRGIKTLALRMEKAQDNAKKIVAFLQSHPAIKTIHYPKLGAMLSFETDTPQRAIRLVENTRLITYAESLGCVNSLITIPVLCTHKDVPEAQREARGITPNLIRFSAGIENPKDLIQDISQALGEE